MTNDVIKKIHKILIQKNWKLAVAESCTGGFISASMTALPGSSRYFTASLVAYSAQAKQHILGIPAGTLEKHGVISKEVAARMAVRIRVLCKADYAIATTGNLGPEVLEGKKRGLVYFAASRRGKTVTGTALMSGGRLHNRKRAAQLALLLLLEMIQHDCRRT